ncbi:MAG: hypothetical protein QM796_13185 [Chthoniobacteraceae bacterium]
MAKVFGKAGRNATEESHRKEFQKISVTALLVMVALGVIGGYAIGSVFPVKGLPSCGLVTIDTLLLASVLLVVRWAKERFERFDRERIKWRKRSGG